MNRYTATINFTEHQTLTMESTVYAHNIEDAKEAAKMRFIDSRRDTPTINSIEIK